MLHNHIANRAEVQVVWERRRNRGVPEGEEEEGREVNLMPFLNVAHSLGLACINKVVTRWSQGCK